MDLLPSPEQQQLIDATSRFLAAKLPLDRFRMANRPPPAEHTMWRELAELGCFGLGIRSEAGGTDYSIIEEMLVFECFGRFLLSPAVLGTIVAARIAALAEKRELTRSIIGGESRAAVATPISDSGQFYLIDADGAELLVLWNSECAYLLGRESAAGIETVTAVDETVTVERARLGTADAIARISCSGEPIDRRASILLAAMLVGIAEATLEMAAEYAKTREQFGRPIGSFQAIKHKCADMALRNEAARALTAFAAVSENEKRPDCAFHAAAAKLLATEAALNNAAANIQIHGAMGYSAECHAHLFLKRAHLLDRLGGDMIAQRALLASRAQRDK